MLLCYDFGVTGENRMKSCCKVTKNGRTMVYRKGTSLSNNFANKCYLLIPFFHLVEIELCGWQGGIQLLKSYSSSFFVTLIWFPFIKSNCAFAWNNCNKKPFCTHSILLIDLLIRLISLIKFGEKLINRELGSAFLHGFSLTCLISNSREC